MKRLTTVLLVLASVTLNAKTRPHKPVQSPKATELSAMSGKTMLSRQLAMISPLLVVVPPQTNFIVRKRFLWLEDPDAMPMVSTYTLYLGTNPGVYDSSADTGTNLFYDFSRTNWSERSQRHFVVVTAKDDAGEESLPSNEVHFPAYEPDHFRLTWTSNWDQVTIYESNDLSIPKENWTVTATVFSTNSYSGWIDLTLRGKYFCLDKPDVLTITVFNPNP